MPDEKQTTSEIRHWLLDGQARDGRALWLNEWTTLVQPDEVSAREMVGHSVTYGSTALQAAYILNGGALAALPPLVSGLTSAARDQITWAAVPYVIGIGCAAVASLAAYLNFQSQAQMLWIRSSNSAQHVREIYKAPTDNFVAKPRDESGWSCTVNATLVVSLFAAIGSLIAFVVGTTMFLSLAHDFPSTPTPAVAVAPATGGTGHASGPGKP